MKNTINQPRSTFGRTAWISMLQSSEINNSGPYRYFYLWPTMLMFALMTLALNACSQDVRSKLATEHFVFQFNSEIPTKRIQGLGDTLEANYKRILGRLGVNSMSVIDVFIYADRLSYSKATGNWGASGSIEGVSKIHLMLVVPNEATGIAATHEFTHAVVLQRLLNDVPGQMNSKEFDEKFSRFPVWLWESVANYEAGEFRDPKKINWMRNGCPSLKDLSDRKKGNRIYDVGYTIIEYILTRYGHDAYIKLIRSYGDVSVLGTNEEDFAHNWYTFVEKYLKP